MFAATIALLDASVGIQSKSIATLPVVSDQIGIENLGEVSQPIAQPALSPTDPAIPLFSSGQTVAQAIIPADDGTGTLVNQQDNQTNITAGTAVDQNLFHSFEQFELDAGQTATFVSGADIQTILARVVGGDLAVINGLLEVTGSDANFYLVNPAGIIMGPHATLNLPASFTATTADGVGFGGNWFNALTDNDYELLTGEPDAFLFSGEQSGVLINAADLAVESGETLALIGGSAISTGSLSAENGQVIVQSVTGEKIVRLQRQGMLLSLDVEPVSQGSIVSTDLSLLSLPELLTGGEVASALGLMVAADGTVHLTDDSQPLANGDIVANQVEAGATTLISDNNAYLGTITTGNSTGGGSLFVEAENNILVGDHQAAELTSRGGDILLHSREGEIDTSNATLNSSDPSGQRGGDVVLYSPGMIATGDIVSQGGNIQVVSTGEVIRRRRGPRISYRLLTEGGIDIQGNLDTQFEADGGKVTLHSIGQVTTHDISTGGGDLTIYSGGCLTEDSCDRNFFFGGGIDTLEGTLDTSATASESTGGNIKLHGFTDVFTNEIVSGGGNIELLSHDGEINTTVGAISSAGEGRLPGGDISIDAKGGVTTANISSDGASISLDSNTTVTTASGDGLQEFTLDSSSPEGVGGEIVIEAGRDIVSGNLVSDQGNISLTAEKGDIQPQGVIDTRSTDVSAATAADADAEPSPAVGDVLVSGPNVSGFENALPAGQLLLAESGEVKENPSGDTDGPSLGDAPNAPPTPLAFNRPSQELPTVPDESDPRPDVFDKPDLPPDIPDEPEPQPDRPDEPESEPNLIESDTLNRGSSSNQAWSASPELARLEQLGALAYQQGNYKQAVYYYQQRLALAQTSGDTLEYVRALADLATAYSAMGRYEQAIEHYQQALETARTLTNATLVGDILHRLGMVYYAQHDYENAVTAQQQSLAIAQQTADQTRKAQALSQLGLTHYAQTDYSQAIELHSQSLSIAQTLGDDRQVGLALEYLGLAYYAVDEFELAADALSDSLALAQQQGSLHAEARRLTNLGDALYRTGDAQTAVAHLSRAIDIWDALRQNLEDEDLNRVAIFETQETTYSTLERILAETGLHGQALEMTERGRARAFVELLQQDQPTDSELIDVAAPTLEEIRAIATEQNVTLVSYSIIKQVNDHQGTRQLENSELYIWVATPDDNVEWRRRDLTDLDTSLETLTQAAHCFEPRCWDYQTPMENRDRVLHQPLRQLHQLLIEPVADLLPSNPGAEVVLIPHQELFLVPFAALQNSNGDYLIEQHTLRTSPSIQVLDLTHRQQLALTPSDQPPLVVGNPTTPDVVWNTDGSNAWSLAALPGAKAEALKIAELLETTAVTENQATEKAVVDAMQQAPMIHLATHGLLDYVEASGVPGAIALTPSDTEDGLLTTQEIMDLDLSAELVVLSACDTGRGHITSDGVIGLSRSLMATGVPSVMVSLWKVPDLATQELMIQFYQQLEDQPNKAQAIRQAMLKTMQQYPSPRDWAAFTLMGQG